MPDFPLPPLDVGERFYRALLHLYPRRFRRTFALELIETFRDQRREVRRVGTPAAVFWLAALYDVLVHALAEWTSTLWRAGRANSAAGSERFRFAARKEVGWRGA